MAAAGELGRKGLQRGGKLAVVTVLGYEKITGSMSTERGTQVGAEIYAYGLCFE